MKNNNSNNYISIKKLFNACRYYNQEYHDILKYLNSSFYLKNNYITDYGVDIYDYKNDYLVLSGHTPFDCFNNEYLYFKLDGSCVVPGVELKTQKEKEKYDEVISRYCGEITDAIILLKRFKDFKTSSRKDIKLLGSSYLLNINSFYMGLSLKNDGTTTFYVQRDFYFDSIDYKSNSSKFIDEFSRNEKDIINNSYVNINDLPKWCVDSIYDYSNRDAFNRFINKFKKNRASSDIISNLKKSEQNEDAKNKKLNSIIQEISGLINEASLLFSEDDYKRFVLDDYSILFEKKDDHLEIRKDFVSLLKYIDLSFVPFDNVYVSGIDFTDCNMYFNPQKVYKKDLSFCIFGDADKKENVLPFSIFTNFRGVDLRGTVINDSHSDFRYNLVGAIVDENTSITFSNDSKNKDFLKKKDM